MIKKNCDFLLIFLSTLSPQIGVWERFLKNSLILIARRGANVTRRVEISLLGVGEACACVIHNSCVSVF